MNKVKPKQKIINKNKQEGFNNVINFHNKFLRNDKELLELLKFIFSSIKRRKKNKNATKLLTNQYNHEGIKKDIEFNKNNHIPINSQIESNTLVPSRQFPQIQLLGNNHNINQYRMIESEIHNLRNDINKKTTLPMLENRHEPPINFTYTNPDAFELVKKVAKYRDPNAAKELVRNVPEFKNMMEDLTQLGASSAKEYIETLNRDIDILINTKNDIEQENSKLNYEIETTKEKLDKITSNKEQVEEQINELNQQQYELSQMNENKTNENQKLNKEIDELKSDLEGMEGLFETTKANLKKYIIQEVELNNKIEDMNNVILNKQDEIRQLENMKNKAIEEMTYEQQIRYELEIIIWYLHS